MKIFWILNGLYLHWTESNKPGIIQFQWASGHFDKKNLEKALAVQMFVKVKKIKFLHSSWGYFFPLAILGLSLNCKRERDVKSSIADDRTMPLFIPGICYLKNMQVISFRKESCSSEQNHGDQEKIRRLFLQVKIIFQFFSLPAAWLQLWALYQTRGEQYCFLSPVSPPEELVLLYKFQLQKVVHTTIWRKPRPSLHFWKGTLKLQNNLNTSMDFSSCCHAEKAVQKARVKHEKQLEKK